MPVDLAIQVTEVPEVLIVAVRKLCNVESGLPRALNYVEIGNRDRRNLRFSYLSASVAKFAIVSQRAKTRKVR